MRVSMRALPALSLFAAAKRPIMSGLCAVGLALIAAACAADGPSLTRPSAVLPGLDSTSATANLRITAASAGASIARVPATLVIDPATCALVPPGTGVISGGGEFLFVTRDNGAHFGFTVSGRGEATDGNGERWHWNDADLFFSVNAQGNAVEQTITEGFHVIGPRGMTIMVRGTFHVTLVDGTLVVEVENGNHEDDEACEGFTF